MLARRLAPLVFACLAALAPARAQTPESLNPPAPPEARWGLAVSTLDGRDVLTVNADQRFQPASVTKLVTTAAAFHTLPDPRLPNPALATTIRIEPRDNNAPPDIAIIGGADALLADDPECPDNCLDNLADIIAAHGIRAVSDVIGDDTLFPHQPWSDGWIIEDLKFRFATATSALTVNENVLRIDVTPGPAAGAPIIATWAEGDDLMDLQVEALTVPGYEDHLRISRLPGTNTMRIHGEFGARARPVQLTIGVDDPADLAARRLARLLEARGVQVRGVARARHRPAVIADEPDMREIMRNDPTPPSAPSRPNTQEIARQLPSPLIDTITIVNKDSHNLFAELLLRRIGLATTLTTTGSGGGSGSTGDGLLAMSATLAAAGVPPEAYDLSDGSGLSAYNRLTPRALTQLLVWSARQPWFASWRDTLPVGGVDGSLEYRFRRSPLQGRIIAKTGSLTGARALSGYLTAASGETLAFTIFVNDLPSGERSPIPRIDALLNDIAAAN